MEKIHNKKKRMPVILRRENEEEWIRASLKKESAQALLSPYDEQEMEAFTISRLITSKQRNPNVPEVFQPFLYPELQVQDWTEKPVLIVCIRCSFCGKILLT